MECRGCRCLTVLGCIHSLAHTLAAMSAPAAACCTLSLVFAVAGPEHSGNMGIQELFGCFLSLNHLPPASSMLAAITHAKAISASLGHVGSDGVPADATLLLSLNLPKAPFSAVSMMARLL